MFTQSNLAELRSPVAPDPVSNTGSHNNRDRNSKENASGGRPVFLVELVVLAWAFVWGALVHFLAILTGRDGNTSVAGWVVPFDGIFVRLADQRMVWR